MLSLPQEILLQILQYVMPFYEEESQHTDLYRAWQTVLTDITSKSPCLDIPQTVQGVLGYVEMLAQPILGLEVEGLSVSD